jgi:hypothetical protein
MVSKIFLKIFHDKAVILLNEILNLLVITVYFDKYAFDSKKKLKDLLMQLIENKDFKTKVESDVKKKIYQILLPEKNLSIIHRDKTYREIFVCQEGLWELLTRTLYLKEFCCSFSSREVSPTEELMLFSLLFEEINDILNAVGTIAKSLKFRRENAYQFFVPFPLLHKRFRIYNSHRFVERYIADLFRSFVRENGSVFERSAEDVKFLLTSDYDIGDTVDKYSKSLALIRGSFFWREMVSHHPILLHEVAHKIYKHLKSGIKRNIRDYLRKLSLSLSLEEYSIPLPWVYLLQEDVFADIFAYLVLGDSYLLSLLFGGLLGFDFYNSLVHNPVEPIEGKTKSFKFVPGNLTFSSNRDKAIIRIRVLIKFRNYMKDRNKYSRSLIIKEADNLLRDVEEKYLCDLFPDKVDGLVGKTYCVLPPHIKERAENGY